MRGLFRFLGLVAAAPFVWTAAFGQYDEHLHVPAIGFSELGLPLATARVNALATDGANRIWVATPEGVSALAPAPGADPERPESLFRRATFFPFREKDGLLADPVSDVAFAALGNDEHFFLGFASGLQYGRVLSTVGLSLPQNSVLLQGDSGAEHVNALAAGRTGPVWVATNSGLREWELQGASPGETPDSPYLEGSSVAAVAVRPDDPATAAAAVGDRVYLVVSGETPLALTSPGGVSGVKDLAYDGGSNLWVLGHTNTRVVVWRYAADDLGGGGPGEEEVDPRSAVPAGPWPLPEGVKEAGSLALDDVQGTVWVAAGSDGAWFAARQDGGLSEWQQVSDGTQNVPAPDRVVHRVFADPAGNVWFGTDQGVEGLVARFLSIDNTRYLGYGTTARITVLDVAAAGSGSVQVEVNGQVRAIPETGHPGVFSGVLRFSEDDGPDAIQIASTAEDTPVTFRYAYDPDNPERALTATATWAHIEDFEDDLWIGGPCFVDTLVR